MADKYRVPVFNFMRISVCMSTAVMLLSLNTIVARVSSAFRRSESFLWHSWSGEGAAGVDDFRVVDLSVQTPLMSPCPCTSGGYHSWESRGRLQFTGPCSGSVSSASCGETTGIRLRDIKDRITKEHRNR